LAGVEQSQFASFGRRSGRRFEVLHGSLKLNKEKLELLLPISPLAVEISLLAKVRS
jgi:hypothetical protein